MSRTDEERKNLPDWSSDRALWRRSRLTDAPQDEPQRSLDLAGFADGLLEPDERDRVAALLAGDPVAAEDVTAAQTPSGGTDELPGRLEHIVARACSIFPGWTDGRVVAFAPPARRRRILPYLAQWGSLAAAIAMASWVGFAMGSDASRTLIGPVPSSDASFLPELFEPGSGFLRDLGEGLRT
jgi:hypothetical protein